MRDTDDPCKDCNLEHAATEPRARTRRWLYVVRQVYVASLSGVLVAPTADGHAPLGSHADQPLRIPPVLCDHSAGEYVQHAPV